MTVNFSSYTVPYSTLATSIIMLLANVLLVEDGNVPTQDSHYAKELLTRVFEGRKIDFIKFIRTNTGMGLKDSKEFMEQYVSPPSSAVPASVVNRMRSRHTGAC